MTLALMLAVSAYAANPTPVPTPGCFELMYWSMRLGYASQKDHDTYEAILKRLGENRWELVSVAALYENNEVHVAYFKRRIACPTPSPRRKP